MDLRRSLAPAALAAAFSPAVLLAPSAGRAAPSVSPLAGPAGRARPAPASPAPWPAYCAGPPPALVPPLDHGILLNPDDHSDLQLGTPGLPGGTTGGALIASPVSAGSGWHDFSMTASLPVQGVNSDLAVSPHAMKWTIFVTDGPGKGSPDGPAADRVQYLNGSVWSDLGRWAGAGTKLVTTPFAISSGSQTATASLRLRFSIGAGAPPGRAYVVEFGSYADAQQGCTHSTFGANAITVGAPGSAPGASRSLRYAGAGAVVIAAGAAVALAARRRRRS